MTRKLDLSPWIFVLLILMALGAADAGAQAKSAAFDDALIGERVKTAIDADSALRTMDISVTVHQKVVHLSGVVDSSADVAKAEALARAVRGVSAVTNAIRVASRPTRA
jgi:osmotically-inducible protein OsmY